MLKQKQSIYMCLCAAALAAGISGPVCAQTGDTKSGTPVHKSIVPDLPPMDPVPVAPAAGSDAGAPAITPAAAPGNSAAAGSESPPPTSVVPPLPVDKPATPLTPSVESQAGAGAAGGPFAQKRQLLKEKVAAAQKQGIGISAYQAEIGRIDAAAQKNPTGDDREALEKRIDSLSSGIDEQLVRSQNLKLQRPSMAGGGPTSGSSNNSAPGHSADSTERLLNALKQRFGNNLPTSIDPATRERLLNSDAAKQLLKRLHSGD